MTQQNTFKGGAVGFEAASNGSAKSSKGLLGYLKRETIRTTHIEWPHLSDCPASWV